MTHTPGPWVIGGELISAKDTDIEIASVWRRCPERRWSPPSIEADANALLIAAAPELLKAVKQAIDDLDDIKTLINSGNVPDNINKSIALKIRDLCTIADKAEGRD